MDILSNSRPFPCSWVRFWRPHSLGVGEAALTGKGGRYLYRLEALPEQIAEPPVVRAPLTGIDATCNPDLLTATADGFLETRWQCGPQVNDQTLTLDLGRVATLGGIAHTLESPTPKAY